MFYRDADTPPWLKEQCGEDKVSRCAREDVSNVKIMLLAYIIKIILITYLSARKDLPPHFHIVKFTSK